ncbi:MAG: 4-hydroxy-tetrahydrodipicolinate reductase [Chloroflexi bacterium]|nr:4-hydroxy-tetrahydrodipicolinate reductase [Chloroflexota bacterium]
MAPLKVVISGVTGKMGVETVGAVSREEDLTLVGGTCAHDRGGALTTPTGDVPLSTDLDSLLEQTRPDVLVDFTNASVAMEAASKAAARSIHIVMGASGFSEDQLKQLDAMANDNGVGIIVAPNFALGAIVLKKLAEQAAPYFEYVDIIESHHEAKIDSPSGFALALIRSLGGNKQFTRNQPETENLANTRGGEHNGISVHSIRMPGKSAHHEVIFGAAGQTLSLRHDTLGRDCYMPGVVRCIRDVVTRPGLVIGLENVLGL